MNKFSQLLLGSTALTFVATAPANAVTINETIDFSNTFAGRTTIGPASSSGVFETTTIFGGMNSLTDTQASSSGEIIDGLDFFRLSGLAAGQSVTIDLRPVAQASGPAPELFAISLMDNAGGFLNFVGDSVPDAAASASADTGASASSDGTTADPSGTGGTPLLNFADSFTFEATALSTGDLNFRLENGREALQSYQLSVTPNAAVAVGEPSSLAGIAAGAAGLGFLAARRRRRRT